MLKEKHVSEFLGIFSVKENPKIPLRTSRAPDIEFQVRRSLNSITILFSQKYGDIRVYTHVPSDIAKDVFYPASGKTTVSNRSGGFFMHALRSVFPGKRKEMVDDGYRSFDDESRAAIHIESVGQRIARLMHMYMISKEGTIPVEYEPNSDDSIPCMVVMGDCQHDFSQLVVFTTDQEEEIKVYFDPSRESFVPIKPIPDFFGIDERTCMICCDANINTVLMDCCHCTTCENCANSLRDGRCPICRNSVTEKIIIPIGNVS
jgi:hypothetical protein